jgi:hypothetical protein
MSEAKRMYNDLEEFMCTSSRVALFMPQDEIAFRKIEKRGTAVLRQLRKPGLTPGESQNSARSSNFFFFDLKL